MFPIAGRSETTLQVIRIDDLSDERLADYANLTDVVLRRRTEPAGGLYIAESPKVIARALAAGHIPRSVLVIDKWLADLEPVLAGHDVPIFVGAPELLELLTGFDLHRGALASMHRPELANVADLLQDARRVVVLEDIVDHTNVGAIVRCCAAFGVDAVLVTPRCADPLYRRAVRVSMGTIFQVPWTRIEPWPESLDMLNELGFQTVALALNADAESLDKLAATLPERLALVLGTEGDGLTARSVAKCDRVVYIPMSGGVDSLNVAAAAAVALWATR